MTSDNAEVSEIEVGDKVWCKTPIHQQGKMFIVRKINYGKNLALIGWLASDKEHQYLIGIDCLEKIVKQE